MTQHERIDHINTVNWFKHHYPELDADLHHFANERRCTPQEGRILKRMGVKRGVPDFFLAIPHKGKAGLWIELKVGDNKPSKEQKEFLARKLERGYEAVCVWGTTAARDVIAAYLKDYKVE
jgi:VRR-NUC domain-containing protein